MSILLGLSDQLARYLTCSTIPLTGDRTEVLFRVRFETAADCDKVKSTPSKANEQNLDRLEALLASR
ncbi:MAG TPA: hypothetical protein VIE46_07075 [Gemmatimonadales bacterium]|jgi:hypothetical protein